MQRNDFCVFILSHGRADNVETLKTLISYGYKGDWYIIIDDEDEQGEEYLKRYGSHVRIFNKQLVGHEFDICDNFEGNNVVVYARNVCWSIAKELGYKYFLQLDDDYKCFLWRKPNDEQNKLLGLSAAGKLDDIFAIFCKFLETTPTYSIAFSQGGDFIGGVNNQLIYKKLSRKVMNSFFCRTDRPFKFIGRINEDVNTYCLWGSMGLLFFTYAPMSLLQEQTQKNKGGLTEFYLATGTYVKSFYTVMLCPSFVSVAMMGGSHKRMHHKVNWNNGVPKILSEKWKK